MTETQGWDRETELQREKSSRWKNPPAIPFPEGLPQGKPEI